MLYYDPSKNPDGRYIDGVPLRHLTDADLAALPKWLLASVAACGFYTTEAPPEPEPAVEPEITLAMLASKVANLAADLPSEEDQPPTIDAENPAPRRLR